MQFLKWVFLIKTQGDVIVRLWTMVLTIILVGIFYWTYVTPKHERELIQSFQEGMDAGFPSESGIYHISNTLAVAVTLDTLVREKTNTDAVVYQKLSRIRDNEKFKK